MIRPIMRDIFFLGQKSEPAVPGDASVAQDLLDTLKEHRQECVGMAANMIGIKKRIIVVTMGPIDVIMYNPVIKSKRKPFQTEEGCLSLTGIRKTERFEEIEVEYQDIHFMKQQKKFSGWTAQIIQHECDHLDGIII